MTNSLAKFEIAGLSHTGLFGVFLGTCAIDDALNILHTGVGCKVKTQRQLVFHDPGFDSHTKIGWTELDESDLIKDPAACFKTNLVELYNRRKPKVMFVTASTAVEFTGLDLAKLSADLEEQLNCPIIYLPKAGMMEDLYQGYAALIEAVIQKVDWGLAKSNKPKVSLVGHLFHRHEMEQAANLAELTRLLAKQGIELGSVFLSGSSYGKLLEANQTNLLVNLPYSGLSADRLEDLSQTTSIDTPLPLGIRATNKWLFDICQVYGIKPTLEEKKVVQRLELAKRYLSGRRLAIIGDSPAASGWSLLAEELDMTLGLVVLLDKSLGGKQKFEKLLSSVGSKLAQDLEVVECPSLNQLRRLANHATFDLVVRPDLGLAQTSWENLPTVEYGFPSNHKHFIYPMPELGYAGAIASAQRLQDALLKVS
jgi:nitrogenase molybdenum-iron protein alpha/beta subunit